MPQVHERFMVVDEACHFVVKNKSYKGNTVLECKEAHLYAQGRLVDHAALSQQCCDCSFFDCPEAARTQHLAFLGGSQTQMTLHMSLRNVQDQQPMVTTVLSQGL